MAVQKMNFNPYRIIRAPPSAKPGFRNRPAGEVITLAEIVVVPKSNGLTLWMPYCRWLKILKASMRNSIWILSVTFMFFVSVPSKLLSLGVREVNRPRFPGGHGSVVEVQAGIPMYSAFRGSIGVVGPVAASGLT